MGRWLTDADTKATCATDVHGGWHADTPSSTTKASFAIGSFGRWQSRTPAAATNTKTPLQSILLVEGYAALGFTPR